MTDTLSLVNSSLVTMPEPNIQMGKVKGVLSGDTVVLASAVNPKQERTLSLAFVSAPRLKRDGDEVCTSPSFSTPP
jgi:hypothetical protein